MTNTAAPANPSNLRLNTDEDFDRRMRVLTDPAHGYDFELPEGTMSLPDDVWKPLWDTYIAVVKRAYQEYAKQRAALSDAFDRDIDMIYSNSVAYPFTLRAAKVDNLVDTYYQDRARLVLNRNAAIHAGQVELETAVREAQP